MAARTGLDAPADDLTIDGVGVDHLPCKRNVEMKADGVNRARYASRARAANVFRRDAAGDSHEESTPASN